MPVTVSVRCTKIVVGSLAKSTVRKRRCLVWDARRGTECLSKEAVPQLSSRASDKENEAEIIQRATEGDPTAFECLYRSHCKRVYAVCLRMVGNTTEAEDLTQDAFLLLFRKIHTFRGESAFSTWLHRLVVNTVLMHLRKKSLPVVSMETGPLRMVKPPRRASKSPLLTCYWRGRLIESISAAASRSCQRALAQYLSCTISRGTNIARSRRCWDAPKASRSRNCTGLESGCANCCMKFSGKSIAKSAWPPRRHSARMRTEFEIGGEEKRPIGTCAVQGGAFKPIIQEDRFSVVPANPKALSQCLAWRFPGIGN